MNDLRGSTRSTLQSKSKDLLRSLILDPIPRDAGWSWPESSFEPGLYFWWNKFSSNGGSDLASLRAARSRLQTAVRSDQIAAGSVSVSTKLAAGLPSYSYTRRGRLSDTSTPLYRVTTCCAGIRCQVQPGIAAGAWLLSYLGLGRLITR